MFEQFMLCARGFELTTYWHKDGQTVFQVRYQTPNAIIHEKYVVIRDDWYDAERLGVPPDVVWRAFERRLWKAAYQIARSVSKDWSGLFPEIAA